MEKYLETVYVPTRDGEQLFTIILRPKKEGKYPVILERCPYLDKTDVEVTAENVDSLFYILNATFPYESYLAEGYCYICQEVRATGNSTGDDVYWAKYEYNDAYDTMEWLRKQDFYNGEIFRYGASHTGMTCLIDGGENYPDLKGIIAFVPGNPMPDIYLNKDYVRTGLGFQWEKCIAQLYHINPELRFNVDALRTFPQKDQPKLIFGEGQATGGMFADVQQHQSTRDPYWTSEEGPGHEMVESLRKINVPVLLISGCCCHVNEFTVQLWNEYLSDEARSKSACLVGPYAHNIREKRENWVFDMEGASSDAFYPRAVMNWCNHIRFGEPLEGAREGKFGFFPENSQCHWYFEDKFTDGETAHVMHLNADRTLSAEAGPSSEITYLYNPYDPVIYYEGAGRNIGYPRPVVSEYPQMAGYLSPQDAPNWRHDVISFVSEPFAEKTCLKGRMFADLRVRSDCEDTCFYVRVMVMHDGASYPVRDDITSISWEHSDYKPGDEVTVRLETPALAWELQPGDRLRVDVTSSSFPNYSIHTNVRGKQCDVEQPKLTHNTIVCGASTFTFHTSALSPADYEIVEVHDSKTEDVK